jgi:hypothetical protein
VTTLETESVIIGSFGIASQALYYLREAIRQNWVKVSVSASVAGPDARWPAPRKERVKPPKAAEDQPRQANGQFASKTTLHEAGTEAA